MSCFLAHFPALHFLFSFLKMSTLPFLSVVLSAILFCFLEISIKFIPKRVYGIKKVFLFSVHASALCGDLFVHHVASLLEGHITTTLLIKDFRLNDVFPPPIVSSSCNLCWFVSSSSSLSSSLYLGCTLCSQGTCSIPELTISLAFPYT